MPDTPWPLYVINLADNKTRLDRASRELSAQGLTFTRIDGVNGWDLTPDDIAKVYDADANRRHAKQTLIPAEIGCYLSHIRAWERIAQGAAPGGIVLEDDFQARPALRETLHALCHDPAPEWDIAKLFSLRSPGQVLAGVPLSATHMVVIPYRVPTLALGYALTKSAAQTLLSRVPPFARPIDEDHKFLWEHGLRVALVTPSIIAIGEQRAETGTIGQARRKAVKPQLARKLWYQIRYQARLHWHRLKAR